MTFINNTKNIRIVRTKTKLQFQYLTIKNIYRPQKHSYVVYHHNVQSS